MLLGRRHVVYHRRSARVRGSQRETIFSRPWAGITYSFGNVVSRAALRDGERDKGQLTQRGTSPDPDARCPSLYVVRARQSARHGRNAF